ncbi:hypothetical protein B0H16DRAFT_1723783 [Mycena metata]|uniref:SH3 domain-containing protein n=1 Tax=Mycena metata TaxID=1033252 RepID=A0AAD7IWL7_9AGAR|nr:hypothetical protein B0H16DRAFT_1723783 [Mycena metata]
MSGVSSTSSSSEREQPKICPQQYSATALYDYTADPDDPLEISFFRGEVLDIIDPEGKWWWVLKDDGTVGIAPSNFLRNGRLRFRAKALHNYTADVRDKNEVALVKGEQLHVLDQQGTWWQVKKADGVVGYVPSQCLTNDPNIPAEELEALKAAKRASLSGEIKDIFGTFLEWQSKRVDQANGLGGLHNVLEEPPIVYKYTAEARFTCEGALL